MRFLRLAPILAFALASPSGATAAAAPPARHTVRTQTLFFDAIFTHGRTAGPDTNHVGHQQIAGGVLDNAAGRPVGRFQFTCTWTRILAHSDALEHCAGSGQTGDGQVSVAGPARKSDITHAWNVVAGTRTFRDARGTLVLRDLGNTESLITLTVTPRGGALLNAGAIPRPAANTRFIARADQPCRRQAELNERQLK